MMRVLRLMISLALIAVIGFWHGEALLATFAQIEPLWIALALLVSIVQVMLSAWRWRFTATQLNAPFGLGLAIREYYLATLVNQILPGGVLGDAQRAWRHGRELADWQPAAQAVVIERLSGQIAIALLVLASWPWLPLPVSEGLYQGLLAIGMVLAGGLGFFWLLRAFTKARLPKSVGRWVQATHSALLTDKALPVQLGISLLIAISYIAVFSCSVLAVGPTAEASLWLPLLAVVLLAMLIPITIAGWGLREGAAALLWPLAGLPAAEGIAAAITYGLVCLLASLPGALFIARR